MQLARGDGILTPLSRFADDAKSRRGSSPRDHERVAGARRLLMRARMQALVIVFSVLVALPAAARAETLVLLPASGVNVAPGLLAAASDVLRGHLVRLERRVLVAPGEPGTAEADVAAATEQARAASADGAVVLHVTRLASTARVRLTVIGAGGEVRWIDEMPAATPDDLHPVLDRLARGYVQRRPQARTADIETVTEAESLALRKRKATHTLGVELGLLVPTNVDGPALPGAALFWLYDARSFLAEISVGFHEKDGDGGLALGLGAYYPLSRADLTPYLGGGLRWATLDLGDGGGSGLQVYGSLGLLLGRLSSVQIRADLSYFVNTFERRRGDDLPYETAHTAAQGVTFGIGIGF
jgi:hypothetical protein